MKNSKSLTIIWVLLVVLTLVEYSFTEISLPTKVMFFGIMGASLLKYIGVAFEFLELKHAHGFWKFFAVFIVLAFLTLLTVVYI
jgi:hypothetical protein